MDRRLLLVAALVLVCTVGTLVAGTCEPDCSGLQAGTKVPDPYNCTNYYICLGVDIVSDAAVPCPGNTIFMEESGQCESDNGDGCSAICQPSGCDFTCSFEGDFVADPKDCGIYLICGSQGDIVEQGNCPVDVPYFNGSICVTDESVCCSNQCTAYCYPGVFEAPDPLDCTGYYMCPEEGPADPALHHYCSVGEVFHLPAGRCLAGMPCVTLCGQNPPGGTTTTPPSITTTTTTTTRPSDCVESFTCSEVGDYPMCQSCQPYYFECPAVGADGIITECAAGWVVNPDPDCTFCMDPTECPYDKSCPIQLS